MRTLVLTAVLAAAPALAKEAPAATLGSKASAQWSETTEKAAGAADQKAQLKKGKAATVTGEVIDVSCFLQLHKRGAKHIPCGTKCIQNGQPIGLVDDAGNVYVLFAEAHDPRRDGQVDLKTVFLPLLAKRVTVSGMVEQQKGTRALFVDTAALSEPPAPAPSGAAAPAGATGASGTH